MLNKIWGGMILVSFLCAAATGRMGQLSQAVMEGSGRAVTLTISMAGMMCTWTGLLKVAESAGITRMLSRIMAPAVGLLLPGYRKDGEAVSAASMNITANLLGIGNAATPLGIAAMKAMAKEHEGHKLPDRGMIRFVILNTASIQLIPTYTATLRMQYGSTQPFAITPAVWLVSAAALTAALTMGRILESRWKHG